MSSRVPESLTVVGTSVHLQPASRSVAARGCVNKSAMYLTDFNHVQRPGVLVHSAEEAKVVERLQSSPAIQKLNEWSSSEHTRLAPDMMYLQ
jgi:hypothetical protein